MHCTGVPQLCTPVPRLFFACTALYNPVLNTFTAIQVQLAYSTPVWTGFLNTRGVTAHGSGSSEEETEVEEDVELF